MLVSLDYFMASPYFTYLAEQMPDMFLKYKELTNLKGIVNLATQVIPEIYGDIPVAIVDCRDDDMMDRKIYGMTFHTTDLKPMIVIYIGSGISDKVIRATWKHEAVHAKQIREGRLEVDHIKNKMIWEGVEYDGVVLDHWLPIDEVGELAYKLEYMRYYSQPWEFEANEGIWHILTPEFSENYSAVCALVAHLTSEQIMTRAEEMVTSGQTL